MNNELNKLKEIIAQNLKGVLQLEIDNLAKELIKYYQPRILEENGQLNTEEQDKFNSGKYNCVLESLSKERRLSAELQKEIERLKDENCHDYHCMCLVQQENTELQKQVDEWKLKAKELEEAWEISSKNEVELSKSNDSKLVKILKLQEQVDELKEQKAFWEGMHDRVCSELEELQEEKSNTDLITQIYVLKNKLEQTIKDTAKEILYGLLDIEAKDNNYEVFFLDICEKIEKFAKKFGVEVE